MTKNPKLEAPANIPDQLVAELVTLQNGFTEYHASVTSPLMSHYYLEHKEDFNKCVESVVQNGLKFIMIEADMVNHYQRNITQELFGRIFRNEGSLSAVLKINIKSDLGEPIVQYCYIEEDKRK